MQKPNSTLLVRYQEISDAALSQQADLAAIGDGLRHQEASTNLQIEYQEVGEGYRKGFDLIFNASQQFLLLQGDLATALGLLIANASIQKVITFSCGLKINVTIMFLSVLALASGMGAILMARRFHQYATWTLQRGAEIEKLWGQTYVSGLHRIFQGGTGLRSASNVAVLLFVGIVLFWFVFLADSTEGVMECANKTLSR